MYARIPRGDVKSRQYPVFEISVHTRVYFTKNIAPTHFSISIKSHRKRHRAFLPEGAIGSNFSRDISNHAAINRMITNDISYDYQYSDLIWKELTASSEAEESAVEI